MNVMNVIQKMMKRRKKMKIKHWLTITAIGFVPFIMLFLFYGSMGLSWWLIDGDQMPINGYAEFMQGHMNNKFVAICSLICFVSLFIMIWTTMKIYPHHAHIDHLEVAKDLYYEEAEKMRKVKEKYEEIIEEEMTKRANEKDEA